MRTIANIAAYAGLLLVAACKPAFEPIDYGKDACANCKMTIVDARFASELLTGKGRVYKFDDLRCLKEYIDALPEKDEKAKVYVANFGDADGEMIDARQAMYLEHEFFSSPMNGNTAAFAVAEDAQHYTDSLSVSAKPWDSIN